jgi:SusD family.
MKKKKYIWMILAATMLMSCESWLEMKPKNALPGSITLATLSGNESLLLGAYDYMQGTSLYGRNMICVPEILADNCGMAQGGYMFRSEYRNLMGAGVNIWGSAFQVIAITNDIIDATGKLDVSGADAATRDKIKGEALFIRGLLYFDLLRAYAREPQHLVNNFELGVPLITTPFVSMGPDAYPERARIAAVWQQVESDLNTAFSLLQGNDGSNFPQRANHYAAKALLARAFLYQGKWSEAVEAATWVISQNRVSIHSGNIRELYTGGVESLLELRFATSESLGSSSLHAMYATFDDGYRDAEGYGNGRGSGEGELIIAENLRVLFEDGDKRLEMMRKAYFGSNKVWWTTKFNSWGGSYGQDNVPMIRISEVYLIRAEAALKMASPVYGQARSDINALRAARGLAALPGADASLMDAVLKERRLELCFEGHRFFDLKRQGKDITKEAPSTTLPYTDFKVVAGIPQTEMDVNKNLVNNPGY